VVPEAAPELLLFKVRALVTLPATFAVQAVHVPVRFVITPEAGVPKAGAVPNDVSDDAVTPEARVVPVRFAAGTELAVQDAQVPVRLVIIPDAGVPRFGVTRVGEVAATGDPVPVVAVKEGAAVEPVKFPNAVLAVCVSKVAVTVPEVVTALDGVAESTTPSPVKVTLVTVPPPPPPPVESAQVPLSQVQT
jgi:hypothetical protein